MPALDNARYEVFAQHYVANGYNSLKAGRAAGVESPTIAQAWSRYPAIRARVGELMESQFMALHVDALAVKEQLARIAFADPRALFDPTTGELKPIHDLDDDTAASIASVDVEIRPAKFSRDGEELRPETKVVKIRRVNPMEALTVLAKHHKVIGDTDDGVNALANALSDRLNAAKRRLLAGQPQAALPAPVDCDVVDVYDPVPVGETHSSADHVLDDLT